HHGRIDQHAYRDEEDGGEEIGDGPYQVLDALRLHGFCQQGAHDERAQRGAEASLYGKQHHHQAEAHGDDQQRLVVHQLPGAAEEGGDEEYPAQEPQDEEEAQLAHLPEQFAAREVLAHRHGAEHHQQQNGHQILHDEHAEDEHSVLLGLHAQLVERADDDGGGGDRKDAPEENAVHGVPAQELAGAVAEGQHAHGLHNGRDPRRAAHRSQFLKAELEAQAEEQEDHPDLRPRPDVLLVHHRGDEGDVRAHQHPRDDIAQNNGQHDPLEHQ